MIKRVQILLILIISSLSAKAAPIGGEVYYRHLKNMEYEVTIVAYRDCRAGPIGLFDLFITNDSFSVSTKTTRVKIEDLSVFCNTKPCTPSNTTVGKEGIEAHYYLDTIDFNSGFFKLFVSKKNCTVNFGLNTCCRNGAITTITQGAIYYDAMLNLCAAVKSPINSPRIINKPSNQIPCNQTYSESYAADGYLIGDSVGYELVKAQSGYKLPETYSGSYSATLPLTPFCVPVGSINCVPNLTNLPIRGINFNNQNGNFITTPSNCAEVPVIVVQVNLYRKDSGKYKLIGYVKRDMMHIIYKSNINKPTLTTYKAYTIKARENTCIDIRIKDDTTSANKDTVKLIVKRFPKYGTLSLVDSNAREKILHYCWNVTDLDFQNKLEDNVLIYAYDKPCLLGQSISTTINFKSAAPDSITTIQVKTFYDINKNGKREIGEPYRSAPVLINRFGTLTTLNTDLNGLLTQKPLIGNFNIGLLRNQFTYSTNKDSAFIAKFDSSYSLEIGFNYVQGVRGRIFEDVNNNCVFDPFVDVLLGGIKIGEKAKNAVAITDSRGEFLFNNTIGNYALQIDPRIAYRATCINALAVQIKKDSQSTIYDFPLQKKTNYKDIKISLIPSNHIRNDVSFTQQILIENKGLSTVYNFYIKLLPSKKLQQFSSPSSNTNYNDTIFWLIDSIAKGRTKSIDVIHYITKANYTANELVNYHIWTNVQDSVLENNYYTLNETIGDIGCCDGSEKRTYAPNRYFPIDPTITYRLNFTPSGLIKRALVTDTLDASKFDLNSIQLLGRATNHTAYINTNILYVDYYSNTPLSNLNYLYSINLKKSFTDSSTIRNNAYVAFDNGNLQKTNTVANTIISPILYDTAAIADICENQYFNVKFKTNYTPEADNHFKIYLSDSNGGFSQPSLLLDTIGTLKNQAFTIKSPNVNLSHQYKIKVIGSNPPAENFNSTVLPTINIHPLPSIQYTTNIKNNSICYGDTLKIIASGASEYWFYNYAKPGGTFSSNPILSERIFTNGNFEITFKTDKGCLNISKTISAGVISLPVVKLVSPNTKLCEGDALELKFSGAKKYDVYLNSKTKIDSGLTFSPYFIQVPSNKSIYSLVGYDINGCNDSSNKLTVIKNPLPAKPTITRVNRALKSNFSFGNQWLLNGVKIDSAINQFYYPPFDAIYSVQHTDTNTCQNISNVYDVRYTIISYPSIGSTINVYPNPAQNELSIESEHSLSYNFSLFDSYGKLILENNGSQKTVLNISELSTGNYTLRIVQNNLTTHFKVTVLR